MAYSNERVRAWLGRTRTTQAELAAELGHSTRNTVSLVCNDELELTAADAAKWVAAIKAVATRKAEPDGDE